ncbi:MAG: hypothetical protein H6705_10210 [Myxococcales bacterium]|nr:hypothetical protein [Myxococcales bacterium]
MSSRQVGALHGGQRERDVVDGDGELHARAELGVERVGLVGVVERVLDRGLGVGERLDGLVGVDDPGASGQHDFAEAGAEVHHARAGLVVDELDVDRV